MVDNHSKHLLPCASRVLLLHGVSAMWRKRIHKVELASQLSDFATCDWKRAIFEHPRLQNLSLRVLHLLSS